MYDEKEEIFHRLMDYLYENNIDFRFKVYFNIKKEIIVKRLFIESKHVTVELHAPNKGFNIPDSGKLIALKRLMNSELDDEEWPGLSFELLRDNLLK